MNCISSCSKLFTSVPKKKSKVYFCIMTDLPATFVEGFHDEKAVREMKYHKFGRTGLLISALSLGGAACSPFYE